MTRPVNRRQALAALVLSPLAANSGAAQQESVLRIELDGGDFERSTHLSEEQIADVRRNNFLRYYGTATYRFRVETEGWYVLWVGAAPWNVDLVIDGTFLLHTALASGVWRDRDALQRVVSLHFTRGSHTLEFSRPWHAGLPYVRRIVLERSSSPHEMARLTFESDHAVARLGERFAVTLRAGQMAESYRLTLLSRNQESAGNRFEKVIEIPSGSGQFSESIALPTTAEGAWLVTLADPNGFPADREFEYVVVDTSGPRDAVRSDRRNLIETINPGERAPDYSSGDTRKLDQRGLHYLESGLRGRTGDGKPGSWFAYKLNLPDPTGHYVVEIEYPDDSNRAFIASVLQEAPSPYQSDAGVTTGAPYANSGLPQTHEIHFFARQRDPRVLLVNWHDGQRAAVSALRVYQQVDELPLPAKHASRQFGFYLEEPLRFTAYFGADPTNPGWLNLLRCAIRYAEWTRYVGANTWHQTITAYQATLWPAKNLPGLGPDDEGGVGNGLPYASPSLRDPFQKDIVRLQLLVCEKYGLRFVPEVQLFPNEYLIKELFAGQASNTAQNSLQNAPWLTVSDAGRIGGGDVSLPWLNPIFPAVQKWAMAVMTEVGSRYQDSPALQGVAMRLLGYAFGSWQSFASIRWGYDDYTVSQFLKDSGRSDLPLPVDAPSPHAAKFAALTGPLYRQWVEWRVDRITRYHSRLATALADIRPDLKLYVNAFGPHYSMGEYYENQASIQARQRKGWHSLIRETGLDPAVYASNPRIVFSDAIHYPAGAKVPGGAASELGAALYRESLDPAPIQAAAKPVRGGSISHVRFYNQYMELGFDPQLLDMGNPKKGQDGRPSPFTICGLINPGGRNLLARYAEALAAGNIGSIMDGGLGYFLGQPALLRPFLREFGAIPQVGMSPLASTQRDVAVWVSDATSGNYLYVVNRTGHETSVRLRFSALPRLRRIVTDELLAATADHQVSLHLQAWQLVALRNESAIAAALSASSVNIQSASPHVAKDQ